MYVCVSHGVPQGLASVSTPHPPDEVIGVTAAAAVRERREGTGTPERRVRLGGSRGEGEVEDYEDLFPGGPGGAGMIMIP